MSNIYGGKYVGQENASVADALLETGYDFEVAKKGVCVANKMRTPIPGLFSVVNKRSDTPLGVVGSHFKPHSNLETFACADELGGRIIEVGHFRGGNTSFLVMNLSVCGYSQGEEFKVGPHSLSWHVLFTNPHDGAKSREALLIPYLPLTDGEIFCAVQHEGCEISLGRVPEKIMAALEQAKVKFSKAANQVLTPEEINKQVVKSFGVTNKAILKAQYGKKQPHWVKYAETVTAKLIESKKPVTKFDVYVAVCNYLDNHKAVRGEKESAETRLMSRLFLTTYRSKLSAFDQL